MALTFVFRLHGNWSGSTTLHILSQTVHARGQTQLESTWISFNLCSGRWSVRSSSPTDSSTGGSAANRVSAMLLWSVIVHSLFEKVKTWRTRCQISASVAHFSFLGRWPAAPVPGSPPLCLPVRTCYLWSCADWPHDLWPFKFTNFNSALYWAVWMLINLMTKLISAVNTAAPDLKLF